MPKYIVDGHVHFKFKLIIEADSAEKAKAEVQRLTISELEINNESSTKSTVEVNPTVEVIT